MQRIKNLRLLTSFIALSLLIAGIFNFSIVTAEAVPAAPGVHTHTQKDGTVVHYQLHGDEFLNYLTDTNGDLVTFAQDGDIYLARWADKGENTSPSTVPTIVKPTGAVRGARVPTLDTMRSLKTSIPDHHLERAQKARDERDKKWREQLNISSVFGNKEVSSMQYTPRSATGRKVLMIYVSFANNTGVSSLPIPSSQTLYNMMFNENTFGTVAHYYKTVTNSTATISPATTINTTNQGIIFVQLPGPHGNWGHPNVNDPRNSLIIPALIKAANPANPGGYINYSMFDTNGNGTITTDELSIGVIVHGYETSSTGGTTNPAYPSIWGHSSSISPLHLNNVYLSKYFTQGAYQSFPPNPQLLTIGVIAHELGHNCFGFIDLYDTSYIGSGVGMWSLMASGSWSGSPGGSSPSALDAFHLYGGKTWGYASQQLIAPKPVTSGTNILTGATQYAKLETADTNQYFLVQPRGNVGYDSGIRNNSPWTTVDGYTESGLLFLLVDDNLTGSNNLSTNSHYHVSAVHAIPPNFMNALFSAQTKSYINDTSTPSSKIYASVSNSTPTVTSGWSISSITSSITGIGTTSGTTSGSFFVVNRPIVTSPEPLPGGSVGSYYFYYFNPGMATFDISIINGSLPPGLELDGYYGTIFGTPTTAGTFYFTLDDGSFGVVTYSIRIE